MKNQSHLDYKDTINLGSFYTPSNIVKEAFKLITKHIKNFERYTCLDTSCGYGNLIETNIFKRNIGADIDEKAIALAKEKYPFNEYYIHNSLKNVDRKAYNLLENEKIIMLENPPYNDTTSIIKNGIKEVKFEVDTDLKARDLGISFLLSYNKLKADYVLCLHPLSYLIKKTNFNMLKSFKDNYKLIDALIFDSREFLDTSKLTGFPIVIALYKRSDLGMDYNFIYNFLFKTIEGKAFQLSSFDFISNYITKYPNKHIVFENKIKDYFWTMRDINALRRSRTFIDKDSYNAIYITKENFKYYAYVDVFKMFLKYVPYYLGNIDVFINNEEFLKYEDIFKKISLNNNYVLKKKYKLKENITNKEKQIIEEYFTNLLRNY